MTRPLSVCYFGAYRPDYPRNLTIRKALALAGVPVTECRVPPKWPSWRRWPTLTAQFFSQFTARSAQVIIVAEFCHTVVPLAWALSRLNGAALIFDPGLSFYDEMILRQHAAPENSLRARYFRSVDAIAFHLADLVVWFTPVDEEYFGREYGIAPHRSAWLPPGVDETLFGYSPALDFDSLFVVHWDGSFIPSHGVDVILEAANLLRDHTNIRFELVGNGPMAEAMRAKAESLKLTNAAFLGTVSARELSDSVRRAHVCLGAFRADDKGRRSLFTKELQAMLAGRALITAEGEAKRQVFDADRDLWLIPPDDPSALADAILTLQADSARRRSLGECGHAAAQKLCGLEASRMRLMEIIERALIERHGIRQKHPGRL